MHYKADSYAFSIISCMLYRFTQPSLSVSTVLILMIHKIVEDPPIF